MELFICLKKVDLTASEMKAAIYFVQKDYSFLSFCLLCCIIRVYLLSLGMKSLSVINETYDRLSYDVVT